MDAEVAAAQRLVGDFEVFCATFVRIKDKDGNIVPFILNPHQKRLWRSIRKAMREDRPIRIVILKARQLGFSTFMQALLFWLSITRPGTGSLVVAHKDDAAAELFGKIELMYRYLPVDLHKELDAIRITSRQGKKLGWGGQLNTNLYVDTANNKNVGRSQTFQAAHLSEVAFYENPSEIMYGMLQALPKRGFSLAVVESTANGTGNYYHNLWVRSQRHESGWEGLFFSWKDEVSYRMTPPEDFKRTPEEDKLAKKYKLDDDQLYWRRYVIEEECEGDVDLFRQEYPIVPEEAFIVSGSPYFGAKVIEKYQERVKEPLRRGRIVFEGPKPHFVNEALSSRYDPPWWIWARPVHGHSYAIGADVAGGTARDYSAAHVIDLNTTEIVATFRGKLDPDDFARELKVMGQTYNMALLAPEKNGEGRATLLKLLKDLHYPRIFYHQFQEEWSGGVQSRYGWTTSSKTRPVMLGQCMELLRKGDLKLYCERTVREMGSFVRVEKTSKIAAAAPGAFDDMVMSLCIATSAEVRQVGQVYVELDYDLFGNEGLI